MYQVKINGIDHNAPFETEEEAQAWIAKKEEKLLPWGLKKDRWLFEESFDEDEIIVDAAEMRVIEISPEISAYEVEEYDEDSNLTGNMIQVPLQSAKYKTEYRFEAEYVYEIVDLSLDADWQLKQCFENRKKEYPMLEELIVALWEGDQASIDALEAARQAIKAKYPKP